MKNLMPISPGGAGLQFVQLPGLPEVTTAQQVGQYFKVGAKRIGEAIKRNSHLFELWARRATDQETDRLRPQFATQNFSKSRTNPILITFEGTLLLATCMRNPKATEALLSWATATNRIRQQQSLLIREQIENDAPMEQIARVIEEPEKPRKPPKPRLTCTPEPDRIDAVQAFADQHGATKANAMLALIETGLEHPDEAATKLKGKRHDLCFSG